MLLKIGICSGVVNFYMNSELKKILLTFAVFERFLDPYRKMN